MDRRELELKLIYAIIVAGKSARFANGVIERAFKDELEPLEKIREELISGELMEKLAEWRTGNYIKNFRALEGVVTDDKLNLETCTPEELQKIPGIGPKTARFFIVWTRPDARYAVLDTHVLKWLAFEMFYDNVPTSSPQKPEVYKLWEDTFIREADRLGKTPRELDLEIWEAAATAGNRV